MNVGALDGISGSTFQGAGRVLDSALALRGAHAGRLDSVRVETPLPGAAGHVVRFLLTSVPPWIQVGGLVLAVVVGLTATWWIIKHLGAIRGWVVARSQPIKIALAIVTLVLLVGITFGGTATWNYTQHSNDFCKACHVMDRAVERMAGGKSKHAKLSCHECHQQPISASVSQLYVWISERPDRITKHANVPNRVCERCHVTGDTATWRRIASTAGHRVHLESDSSVLRNIKCVGCHASELHHFQPVAQTCGKSGCHKPADTDIRLGKMAQQTDLHCTSCHVFTTVVPALATRDSARGTLVPGRSECLGCHQMQKILADFDPARDPHGGKCGTCHNPHTQKTPIAAANSCATAGCHANWRLEPFHSNDNHKRVGSQCLTCHVPHQAKVDASDCQGCHERVRLRSRLRPPLPFDTLKALRRALVPQAATTVRLALATLSRMQQTSGLSRAAIENLFKPVLPTLSFGIDPPAERRAAPDSFSHSRHEKLACLVCHEVRTGRGRLTFDPPRGCMICHHQAPSRSNCETCHTKREYAAPRRMTATVTVPGHPPRPRDVDFLHATHSSRQCLECHTTPVSLSPSPAKAACTDCHEDHHAVDRACATCHSAVGPKTAHTTLEVAHQRCDACHTSSTIAQLTPTRSFCSTCHTEKSTNHYAGRECTTCHFLTDPATYRPMLSLRSAQ